MNDLMGRGLVHKDALHAGGAVTSAGIARDG